MELPSRGGDRAGAVDWGYRGLAGARGVVTLRSSTEQIHRNTSLQSTAARISRRAPGICHAAWSLFSSKLRIHGVKTRSVRSGLDSVGADRNVANTDRAPEHVP